MIARALVASGAHARLTALRERLQRDLERRPDELPSKEWVRVARLYQDGYRTLATLELETAKVHFLAERAPMTDEEVARGIAELGREAVRALSDDELHAEMQRRRRCRRRTSDRRAGDRRARGRRPRGCRTRRAAPSS